MPIDPTPIVPLTRVQYGRRPGVKITHGRLSSRHLCQYYPRQLSKVRGSRWKRSLAEAARRRGGRNRCCNRSYSISVLSTDHAPLAVLGRVTSVELALLAVLYVPTITLTPSPMPYDPKKGGGIFPRDARRDRRPPRPHRADLTILESEMLLRTLVPGGPYHSVCAAQPQSCMKERAHTHEMVCSTYRNVTQHASLAGLLASPPRAGSESRPHVQTLDWNTVP
eukprot:scaffold55588_cov67-Phaeocystis_antarctica.AAC.1